VLVLFTGIGPLVAWRRVSWEAAWRIFRWPALIGAATALALVAFSDARDDPLSLALFCFAAFALAALVQEFARGVSVRRALSGGSVPGALVAMVSRNRRRYGGYVVHAGIAIAFIAVAASSAFQTSRDLHLSPGQSASVGDYEVRYVEPTQQIDTGEQRLTFGALLEVTRDGERVATLNPSRNYYSGMSDPSLGPISGFFEGESTSEVGRRDGLGGDVWTAMQPDLGAWRGEIRNADRRVLAVTRDLPPNDPRAAALATNIQGLAVRALAKRYEADPPPANFRVNVNPLVMWIWIGGAIAVGGALIALWPAPQAQRRRVSDVQAARLARDLSRA
jgi:cytochrome c-type biogenesis protein CcmF